MPRFTITCNDCGEERDPQECCDECAYREVAKLQGRIKALENALRYIMYHRNPIGAKLIEMIPEPKQSEIVGTLENRQPFSTERNRS